MRQPTPPGDRFGRQLKGMKVDVHAAGGMLGTSQQPSMDRGRQPAQ
jgi:hypothetical protein